MEKIQRSIDDWSTICNALRTAARAYREFADQVEVSFISATDTAKRMSEQFLRQAKEADEHAQCIADEVGC